MSIMPQASDSKTDSNPVSHEWFPIGEGRAYYGLRCQHTERGSTGFGHESVYRFFDAAGHLLYVGRTWNILARWSKHRRKPWWNEVAGAAVDCYYINEKTAKRLEAVAIATESPRYNIARPVVR